MPRLSSSAPWDALSQQDALGDLKATLDKGSLAAIAKLGVENGFLNNPKVKIPLPPALQKVESGLRLLGMKDKADQLVTTMNRAAEQAVPLAKPLLQNAIKSMTVSDAKNILAGGDTSQFVQLDCRRRTRHSAKPGGLWEQDSGKGFRFLEVISYAD